MISFTVEVRDKALTRVGQILPEDLTISITEQFNNVGQWTLTLPEAHPLVPTLRSPGAGIVVTRDTGTVLMSGPVTSPQAAASSDDPGGTVTFSGVSDAVILADRLAYPDPSNPDAGSQAAAYDVRTGAAETLMHAYVDANVGPSAPPARRDPRLTVGTDGARGATSTRRARFTQLGALLGDIAATEALGFRVVQVGAGLEFQTYPVTDRSSAVRFDIYNGTLASHKVTTAAPGATRVIVAGQGQGEDRTLIEVSSTASLSAEADWGRRIEVFKDRRDTDDAGELTQAGQDELADDGFSQLAVQVVPADDTTWEFGTHYTIGDKVTVVVDGVELSTVVTGYVLKADSDGTRFGALLGDPGAAAGDQMADVRARLTNLETNAEGGGSSVSVLDAWPVGSIYLTMSTTDPATLLGGGTWTEVQGRFLVGRYPDAGLNSGDSGGATDATLTAANLPSHTHGKGSLAVAGGAHTHGVGSLATASAGDHTHAVGSDHDTASGSYGYSVHVGGTSGAGRTDPTSTAGAHTHTISGSTASTTPTGYTVSGSTGAAGSDTPDSFSILPPYLAVYMWLRTA